MRRKKWHHSTGLRMGHTTVPQLCRRWQYTIYARMASCSCASTMQYTFLCISVTALLVPKPPSLNRPHRLSVRLLFNSTFSIQIYPCETYVEQPVHEAPFSAKGKDQSFLAPKLYLRVWLCTSMELLDCWNPLEVSRTITLLKIKHTSELCLSFT